MNPDPVDRAARPQRLQPRRELVDFDTTPEGQHLARLTADVNLLLELQLHNFAGRPWDRFAEVLVAYGYQVMTAWIATGQIFSKLREKRITAADLIPARPPLTQDQVHELAGLVLGEAVPKFRDTVLRRNTWDASRGATLKTFFIGHCLLRFPTVYRRWRREELDRRVDAAAVVPDVVNSDDPAERAAARDTIAREVAQIPASTMSAVTLDSFGYTQAEIAELLQMSEGAVESRLYRHRHRPPVGGA
jgi:hypothetical protein